MADAENIIEVQMKDWFKDNQENENHQVYSDIDGSSQSVGAKLEALEQNVDFLMQLGKHQDKLLKQATSEITRLSRIVFKFEKDGFERDESEVFNEFKIYVGNISPRSSTEDLKSYFKKFGSVVDAFILQSHPTSQCGIVEFSEKEMAQAALSARPLFVDNRKIIVNKCRIDQPRRSFRERTPPKSYDRQKLSTLKSSRARRYSPY